MKRREFLYTSGIITGASLLGCNSSAKKTNSKGTKVVTFDLHTHPGAFYQKGAETYTGDAAFLERISEMKSKGLQGAFVCLVADFPLLQRTETGIIPKGKFQGDEGWKVFEGQLALLKGLLKRSEAKIALSAEELTKGDQVKAYIACEGGDFLGGSIERVAEAYEAGVRSIQLVHYAPNELGDLQTSKAQHDGLSSFGKAVVKKMNELGMVIDVAHASAKTVQDVTAISSAPVILSHSILQEGKDRPIAARAISIDHAKMIATNGGVIGMWPSGFSTSFEEFVDHTMRMVDTVGIDHVGIGTDMDSNYKPVIKNYTELFDWRDALLEKGMSESEVAQLAGGNAQRVLEQVLV